MPGKGEPKTSARRMRAAMKQAEALDLRAGGMTFDQIAKRLGMNSRQAAYEAVKAALEKTLSEPAQHYRTVAIRRLDQMLHVLWPKVLKADLDAIQQALRIEHRRAKLLGLDAPAALELSGPGGGPIKKEIEHKGVKDPERQMSILEILHRAGYVQAKGAQKRIMDEVREAETATKEEKSTSRSRNVNGHAAADN